MKTKIMRIEKGEYTDQHGFPHKCYLILDVAEVNKTGKFTAREYYNSIIEDWIWEASDGRE